MNIRKELEKGIIVLSDYAIFEPGIYAYTFGMSLESIVASAKQVEICDMINSEEQTEELAEIRKKAMALLKAGVFGAVTELYGSSKMSSPQYKQLVCAVDSQEDTEKLVAMFAAIYYTICDIYDRRPATEYINEVIDSSSRSWLQKLFIKKAVKKLPEDNADQIRRNINEGIVQSIIEMFKSDNCDCRIHLPISYKEALKVPGCTEKMARYTACIIDTPAVMYAYYIHKLKQRVSRMASYEPGMFQMIVNNEKRLIDEARCIMMLCRGADATKHASPFDATAVAGFLTGVYAGEDGGTSAEVCQTAQMLHALQLEDPSITKAINSLAGYAANSN